MTELTYISIFFYLIDVCSSNKTTVNIVALHEFTFKVICLHAQTKSRSCFVMQYVEVKIFLAACKFVFSENTSHFSQFKPNVYQCKLLSR